MDAKQQANAVLDQVVKWTETARIFVEAGNWHRMKSFPKSLGVFERMLQHVVNEHRNLTDVSEEHKNPTARTIAARLMEGDA